MKTQVPVPSPPGLERIHKADVYLGGIGQRIGEFLRHPHMTNIAAHHPAPGLALALILLALCGVVPAGVWAYKRRHHLRSSIRGLLSKRVWQERWKWHRCFKGVQINGHPAPKSLTGWPTRSGSTLVLRLDGGMNLELLQNIEAKVAAQMRCPIAFRRIHHNPGRCFIDLQRKDSLRRSVRLPLLDSTQPVNFCGPIAVAIDTNGRPVTIDLREKNMLVAGIMGSGKSWFLHVLIAYAMQDSRVQVHMLDGKMGTGFKAWKKSCASWATDDTPDEAMRIVERLHGKLNKIFAEMDAKDERSINWATAEAIHLLVVDEYTAFLRIKGFETALNELIRRGRAGGVIVILATQRPSAKVMDTDLSRLIEWRMALLCADKDSSKMALGSNVVDASALSGKNPGEGWLLAEGRTPALCRGYSLTDRDLASLAARAQVLRANRPQGNVKVAAQVMPDTPNDPRSSNPPSPVLVLLPPQPAPLSPQRRSVLATIADLGPQVEGAAVRKALGMTQDRFSVHANALVTAGYATKARKARQVTQFATGGFSWCWTATEAGNAALIRTDASRNERVAQPKEAGAQ